MKRNILYTIVIAICSILIMVLVFNITTKNDDQSKNNDIIAVLVDSIRYYKGKNDEIVNEKRLLEIEFNDLKETNQELYNKVKSMKVNKPQQVVRVETVTVHEPADTAYVISPVDTVYRFDFTNKWRKLDGRIHLLNDSIKFNIDNDIIYTDATIAIKDSKAYVSSSNPYLKFNTIDGMSLPKERKKRFGIGPYVGVEYDFAEHQWHLSTGLSISYHLFEF